jgi:LysR family hydrogen peroxide-inducible transcriptional activator
MISLIQLEYIVALDNYRNFVLAAEKCFVTQPTLSMQVKKLEDDLGIKVFDRSKQPVVPTDAGILILEQARKILSESGRLKEIVDQFTGDISGELSIGIIPTLAPYLLPLFAGNFHRKYPLVNLQVIELLTDQITARLKTDQLDAGIFVTPNHDPAILEQPVFYEELMGFAHPKHPLLLQQNVKLEDLALHNVWLLSDGHCFRNQVINLCYSSKAKQHRLPFEFESGSLETLMRLINREGGFTIIPELAVLDDNHINPKQTFHFSDSRPVREISVCFSRHFAKRRLVQLLTDEIAAAVPAYMLEKMRGELVNWKTA